MNISNSLVFLVNLFDSLVFCFLLNKIKLPSFNCVISDIRNNTKLIMHSTKKEINTKRLPYRAKINDRKNRASDAIKSITVLDSLFIVNFLTYDL